jgi:hypothetical protein
MKSIAQLSKFSYGNILLVFDEFWKVNGNDHTLGKSCAISRAVWSSFTSTLEKGFEMGTSCTTAVL